MTSRFLLIATSLLALSGCVVRPHDDDNRNFRDRGYERHDDRDHNRYDDNHDKHHDDHHDEDHD
jgi:hypothetical protein